MGAESFQHGFGVGVNVLSALESLRSPGGLGRYLQGETLARENPNVRASLVGSPFSAGLLGVSGSPQPLSLGPGGTGPSAPNMVWQPNLPPLSPEAQAKQGLAQLDVQDIQALGGLPQDQQQQARLHRLGVTPTMTPDEMKQYQALAGPQTRVTVPGPGGSRFSFLGSSPEGQTVPKGFTEYGGKLYRTSPLGGGPGGGGEISAGQARLYDPKILAAIAAGKLNVPGISAEDAKTILTQQSTTKADASFERAQKLQVLKDEAVTTATKTMIDSAPEVKGIVAAIRKDIADLGPDFVSARYQDIMTEKIGYPNRAWAKYAQDVGLLPTKLSQMHGQRGKYIVAEFKRHLEEGKQSSENMLGALDSIDDYADRLLARREPGGRITPGGMSPPGAAPTAMPQPGQEVIPGVRYDGPVQ